MRMYYRGSHFDEKEKTPHPDFVCYAESKDGIQWTKPNLGLVEFNGSKDNNIIAWKKRGHGSFVPFLDTNPACDPGARYKALTGGRVTVDGKNKGRECLHALQSPDGIHWKIVSEGVITDGAFDSQNLAVWDGVRGEYRAFWRYFTTGHTDERGWKPGGFRAIRTATSKDFVHWSNQEDLKYVDSPNEQLYTNAIQPYFRAPHLFIGFPTRYLGRQVEPLFMTSRDGVLFRRWPEALIPTTAPKDRDGNRSNYLTHGLLQLPGNDRELSVYATEAYYAGPGSRVRRFTFRTDGFVSIHAAGEAELLTKTLQFAGNTLQLNCITRDGGSVGVEIQDLDGKPVPGFALADSQPVSGDNIACTVKWKRGEGVGALAGKPVRLRFVLQNADLYALQFQP
jgi:hypothetical protein